MDEITKKLKSGGVSDDIIKKLQEGLGDKFEGEILKNGLKSAAEKLGLDTSSLPEVDFSGAVKAAEELVGKDLNKDGKIGDGDLKTGITEAFENAKEAIAKTDLSEVKEFAQKNATGLIDKIKSLFGSKK